MRAATGLEGQYSLGPGQNFAVFSLPFVWRRCIIYAAASPFLARQRGLGGKIMYRSLFASFLLLLLCTTLLASLQVTSEAPPVKFAARLRKQPPAEKLTPPVLPGIQKDGSITLPTQWSIRPVGKQLQLGDYPINMVLHP